MSAGTSPELVCEPASPSALSRRLLSLYTRCLIWYVLGVLVLWVVGIEGIYGHPTPFYAFLKPDFSHMAWHVAAAATFGAFLLAGTVAARRLGWPERELSPKATRWVLLGMIVFLVVFAATVAMIRGPGAISAAYQRQGHEYIGDIGKRPSIRAFFHDYVSIHPHLSMHAKVHPPGPVVLLWLLSDVLLTQDPMTLSLATLVVGSLALIPLFLWVRDMANQRVALTACLVYALMPSIVLFTATSADVLFMPFTLTTLLCFWRAIHRGSLPYAAAAGVGYAVLSLLSFSLLSIGVFFGIIGIWRLRDKTKRIAVVETAGVMIVTFLAVHGLVRLWSGFDVIACFRVCKAQFEVDQATVDMVTPRYPGWAWKILNPACWVFFAGIPVSVLFVWRLVRPDKETRGLFIAIALTLLVASPFYLARGEGERSAMYLLPFLAVPAAHLVDQFVRQTRSLLPLGVTLVFLTFQCWLIESLFYTYW